jgi:hypothetical protein
MEKYFNTIDLIVKLREKYINLTDSLPLEVEETMREMINKRLLAISEAVSIIFGMNLIITKETTGVDVYNFKHCK